MSKSLTFTFTQAEKDEALRHFLAQDERKKANRKSVQDEMAKEGKFILLDSSFYISDDHELCQRCVDVASIEIDGIDGRDYPDFSDAFVSKANWDDGTPLSDDELNELQNQHPDLIYRRISDAAFGA
ncbi:hypothetical protein EBR66_08595 [bacterium]|nr:hypothetical protein [bacterium]